MFGAGRVNDLGPGIYGTVISASVLVAVDQNDPIWDVVVTVVVTVLVYWLAERYSQVLAGHVRGQATTFHEVRAVLRDGWPMVEASYTPVLVLVAARLLGAGTAAAIAAAMYYSVGLLAALGFLAGRRNGQSGWALAGTVAFVAGLGAAIVMLKYALH